MLALSPSLHIFPVLYGSAACTLALRRHLQERRYTRIALTWPRSCEESLREMAAELPCIQALVLESGEQRAYLPGDPCDTAMEAFRQSLQDPRIKVCCLGPDTLPAQRDASGLPDPWALENLDLRAWFMAHLPWLRSRPSAESPAWYAHLAQELRELENLGTTLLLCHLGDYAGLREAWENPGRDATPAPVDIPFSSHLLPIKEKQLAFALQEIPYYAAYFERNRMDPLATLPSGNTLVKSLLLEIRDRMENEGAALRIPTGRLATCLRYLRRLEIQDQALSPSLYTLAVAVKGTLGDEFAERLLRYAQSYPWQRHAGHSLRVYPEATRLPWENHAVKSRNLLRDMPLHWKRLSLRREPSWNERQSYQRSWNTGDACSHIPEDLRMERLNQEVRREAMRLHTGKRRTSEPFSSSLQDGIDLRETLRHWHEKRLYVKNDPPQTGRIDTVIMVFDAKHDERYPYRCTWYAEHDHESTLNFYGTDPADDLIGPGIGRGRYGGFSLIFPPVHHPDIFSSPIPMPQGLDAHERLVYGTLLFAQKPLAAYAAAEPPSLRLRQLAKRLGKTLLHVPLRGLAGGDLEKLRTFHMLNGKEIRGIARRFIGY